MTTKKATSQQEVVKQDQKAIERPVKLKEGENTYEACMKYIIYELNKIKKKRELQKFCEDNNLGYSTIVMMMSGALTKPVPNVISKVLNILGYKVKTHKSISFKIEKPSH